MRKHLKIMLMIAALSLLCVSGAMASYMDPVSVWVVDCYDAASGAPGQDGMVSFDVTNLGAGTLQYRYGGQSWVDATGNVSISGMSSCKEKVFFRLNGNDYGADLTFSGASASCCDVPTYSTVIMNWDASNPDVKILATNNCDKFAPVPIPGSAIILFTGLLGLFGVRRIRRD